MNDLRERYFSMQCSLFPIVEEEIGELTAKMKEFLRIVELVQPERFINAALRMVRIGSSDGEQGKDATGIFHESSLRSSDNEGVD